MPIYRKVGGSLYQINDSYVDVGGSAYAVQQAYVKDGGSLYPYFAGLSDFVMDATNVRAEGGITTDGQVIYSGGRDTTGAFSRTGTWDFQGNEISIDAYALFLQPTFRFRGIARNSTHVFVASVSTSSLFLIRSDLDGTNHTLVLSVTGLRNIHGLALDGSYLYVFIYDREDGDTTDINLQRYLLSTLALHDSRAFSPAIGTNAAAGGVAIGGGEIFALDNPTSNSPATVGVYDMSLNLLRSFTLEAGHITATGITYLSGSLLILTRGINDADDRYVRIYDPTGTHIG